MPCAQRSWSHPSRVRGLKRFRHLAPPCPVVSHPSRVRGLKLQPQFIGALVLVVAPLAGAWIETSCRRGCRLRSSSHPSRVRGLKLRQRRPPQPLQRSHPSRVRGLKPPGEAGAAQAAQSHPSRVRGLKPEQRNQLHLAAACRTPRGCVD